jgi:hypothetical protein
VQSHLAENLHTRDLRTTSIFRRVFLQRRQSNKSLKKGGGVLDRGSNEELGWLENHPSKFGLIVVSSVKSLVTITLQSTRVNH